MKVLPVAVTLIVVAVPFFAEAADDQTKATTSTATTTASTTTASTTTAAPAATEDSPLVRAAKATGRLNKKPTAVITNETLAKSDGHVTTTKYVTQLPPVAKAEPKDDKAKLAAAAELKKKQQAEEKAKKAEAAKKARATRNAAADLYGEEAEERVVDPAAQEHALQQSTSTQAPSQSQKPPVE